MRMKRTVKTSQGYSRLVVLGVVLGIAIGGSVVLLTRTGPAPSWVSTGQPDVTIQVSARDFVDERSVPSTAGLAAEWVAQAPVGGVLRRTDCQVGQAFESGQAPFLVDGSPIILLHMDSPPYRDFVPGLRGGDVLALERELARLGFYHGAVNGYFDSADTQAVADLWGSVGVTGPEAYGLPIAQLLWIPNQQVTSATCPAGLGQTLAQGDPLFTTGGGLEFLQVHTPTTMIAGDRVVTQAGATVPLPDDGMITDQAFLSAYMNSPRFTAFLKDSTTQLMVTVTLAQPITAWTVPASALYSMAGTKACLLSDSQPVQVRVVASQFGNTLVSADTALGAVTVNPPEDGPPCG